jgi:hypothetical protein
VHVSSFQHALEFLPNFDIPCCVCGGMGGRFVLSIKFYEREREREQNVPHQTSMYVCMYVCVCVRVIEFVIMLRESMCD